MDLICAIGSSKLWNLCVRCVSKLPSIHFLIKPAKNQSLIKAFRLFFGYFYNMKRMKCIKGLISSCLGQLYLKQESRNLRIWADEINPHSPSPKIARETPKTRTKSKHRTSPAEFEPTPSKTASSQHRSRIENESGKEVAVSGNSLASSVDEFEESLLAFVANADQKCPSSSTPECTYDRLVQLHIYCAQAIKDPRTLSPGSFAFYTHLLQALLDFLDHSKGFSVRRVEGKLRRFYISAPSARAKRILISFVDFINRRFLKDLVEFIGIIRPHLETHYILLNETFTLLENDVSEAFHHLIRTRVTSPDLLEALNQKASSHFCKQVKQRLVADGELFVSLLPLQNYKDGIAKLKMVVGCFFLTEEQAGQAIEFFKVLTTHSCEKQMQVLLSKKLTRRQRE